MNGLDYTVEGDKLVITIDIGKKAIDKAPASSSGKTNLVASTNGSVAITSTHCRELKFSLNVMAKK